MFDIFLTSLNAILPIVLLILLGYVLKLVGFLNKNFIKIGNKFVFRVCLPCMLFVNIYDKMNSFADIRWDVVVYSVVVICVIFALGLFTAVFTTKKNKRRGVILQCCFRSNFAIIGLTLVERLGGDAGLAGIVSAFSIPIFNILAVISLSIFADKEEALQEVSVGAVNVECAQAVTEQSRKGERGCNAEKSCKAEQSVKAKQGVIRAKKILLNIIKNPLIIGVVVGLVFVGLRETERAFCGGEVPFRFDDQLRFLYLAVSDLKAIASPLALVILGGQFEFSAVKDMTKEIVVGTVWRIVIAPAFGIGIAYLLSRYTGILSVGAEVYPTLIALFGTPVAVSSAIMAGEMKSDEQLAAQLVVWTSIFSVATVFITVFLLMYFGLLTV